MMIIIALLLLCALGIVLLVYKGMKGPSRTLEDLIVPIQDLLRRGYDGGILLIDVAHKKYFLQLRKYIVGAGNYGIELCFPNSDWSHDVFQKLREICNREKIEYVITEKNDTSPIEFLCIDFGKDSYAAHEFIKRIILELFGMDNNVKLFVRLENATVEDRLIDR